MATTDLIPDEPSAGDVVRRMNDKAHHRIWLLLTRSDSEPIEIFNALVLLWWGFIYILPNTDRGDDFVISPLLQLAPDWVWGSLLVLIALLSLWGVLLDGAIIRRIAMYAAVFWWAAFTTKFGFEFGLNIRLGSTAILALLCAWAAWRVRPWEDG